MATNVSYASSDSELESLLLASLPDFGEHGDGILNSNFLTAMLNAKGRYKEIDGALEFWHGITKEENSNFKTQGKNDDVTVNTQDPYARLRWDPKILTGSVVINSLDKARNKGRAAIRDWVTDNTEQAEATKENLFNSLWWKTTPGTNDPDSIANQVSITPTAGTIGGLTRLGNTYLQNGVNTTAITDIGSEAGIAKIMERRALRAVGTKFPDMVILGTANWAGLAGFLVTQRRYKNDEKMAQIGIESIDLGDATVGMESTTVLGGANTINASRMYILASKYLFIKRLKNDDTNANGWRKQFKDVGEKLNRALIFEWFGNLTNSCPRAHDVSTNVSTT